MYFCPNCSYSFDIVKSSQVSNVKDTRKELNKMADALKVFENNDNMSLYVAKFKRDETSKNKKY